MKSTFNKSSFINSFSINFRNIPVTKIRDQLNIINSVIFFIYNIRRTTSPGTDRGVGSPQPIHTILDSTLSYYVFLTTIAFRNTYPNQPYTSHALHALTWLINIHIYTLTKLCGTAEHNNITVLPSLSIFCASPFPLYGISSHSFLAGGSVVVFFVSCLCLPERLIFRCCVPFLPSLVPP